jgi:hypothetical protein
MAINAMRSEDGFELLMRQIGFVSGMQDNHCMLRKKAGKYPALFSNGKLFYRIIEMCPTRSKASVLKPFTLTT